MKRIKVKLRSRPISGGRRSLYLDYYPPVRVSETMELKRFESLGMYIYEKPGTQIEKTYNKNTLMQAEAICALRLKSVINEEFGFFDNDRLQASFLDYFEKHVKQNGAGWKTAYKHFSNFVHGTCTVGQLNVDLCQKFRTYLLQVPNLREPGKTISQNSAANYFSIFRKLLWLALRDKIIKEDLNKFLDKIKTKPNRREFLTQQELLVLSRTPCEETVLKRASLFSCLTGLRYSDVEKLCWGNIVPNLAGTGYSMHIRTEKTDTEATLPINQDALALCGIRSTGIVFKGLNRTMLQKPLEKWLKQAGIFKHITFHCFRHTYAVLQLASGTDIYTVSKMLTHKHVTTTEIYLELLEETKMETIDRIRIELTPDLDAA